MMAEKIKPRAQRVAPTHPGEVMKEILEEALKLPVAEAAERMGISRQSLYELLRGENRVTADMALRFARLAGTGPEIYLHMQDALDLWEAEQRLAAELKRIAPAAQ
jgi:antitoxin HigA-1